MNFKPILIVAGEPNSIFLEIFFKVLKKNKTFNPIILISSHKLLKKKLSKLNVGEFTDPILTPSGYVIIKLENKKKNETSKQDIEKKIERLVRIKTNQQLGQFSNIYLNKLKKDAMINEI